MLKNITWQSYWTAIAVTTALYYSFAFLLFYRNGRMQKIWRRLSPTPPAVPTDNFGQQHLFQQQSTAPVLQEDGPEYLPAVHSIVDEIHAFFASADNTTATKQDLLPALTQIIQKYPTVKKTAYQYSVNNLIVFLAEQNRSIHLNAEEVDSLWG